MGGALTDAAIRDDVFVRRHAAPAVDLVELISGLERAVLIDGLCPADVHRARDVASALRAFLRQVCGGE